MGAFAGRKEDPGKSGDTGLPQQGEDRNGRAAVLTPPHSSFPARKEQLTPHFLLLWLPLRPHPA